jgi:hypothetical protein
VCILNLDGSDLILSSYSRFLSTETATGTVLWAGIQVCLGSDLPRNFVRGGGGGKLIHLRTKGRENGDLGAVAP